MTVTSFFLLHVATSLLPPHDEIDYEYYTILNLPKKPSVTVQQIRKAYKLLSLQLHPDKVAQRLRGNIDSSNAMSVEEAAILYEKVQEAVNVLSDDSKRQVYINYNYSVARYKFVTDKESSFQHVMEKVVNNMQNSSLYDRTKLWLFTVLFTSLLLLLQPILIAMKINSITGSTVVTTNLMDTSWFYILMPFWICYVGYSLAYIILVLMKSIQEWIRYGPPKTNLPKVTYLTILGIMRSEFLNDIEEEEEEEEQETNDNENSRNSTGGAGVGVDDRERTQKSHTGGTILNSELMIQFLNGCCIPITIIVGMVLLILQWEDSNDIIISSSSSSSSSSNSNSNNSTDYNSITSTIVDTIVDTIVSNETNWLYNNTDIFGNGTINSASMNGDDSDKNWIYTAIPFYGTILCIIFRIVLSLQQIRYVQSSMISNTNHIVLSIATNDDDDNYNDFRNVNSGGNNDVRNNGQSRKKMIEQKYLIVEPDPEKLQITLEVVRQMKNIHQGDNDPQQPGANNDNDITAEEMEYIRIQCSDEHDILERMKKEHYKNISTIVIVYVTQLTVLLCQLQQTISAKSWYIVFLPILIYYGMPMLSFCCSCCCTLSPSEDDRPSVTMGYYGYSTTNDNNNESSADNVDSTAMNNGSNNDIESNNNAAVKSPDPLHSVATTQSDAATNKTNELNDDVVTLNPHKVDGDTSTTATTPVQPNQSTSTNPTNTTSSPEEGNDSHGKNDHPYYHTVDPNEDVDFIQRGISCCSSCCILLIICLMIAKLEQNYSTDGEIDDNGSFNTMWLLSPLFLLSGLIILIFTSCICLKSTPPSDEQMAYGGNEMTSDSNVNAATIATPQPAATFIVPPPPPPQQQVSHGNNQETGNIPSPSFIITPSVESLVTLDTTDQVSEHASATTTAGNEEERHDIDMGHKSSSNIHDLD